MLDVLLTFDVEVWCGGWDELDARFPDAYRRYVYGSGKRGSFGLPYQLDLLRDHGLLGVCFVEPLFATRFGNDPLAETVGLVRERGHEVQLHLHTEWVDEAREPLLEGIREKRQFLRHFSRHEQTQLISTGLQLLGEAGESSVNAFRAGGYGFNRDTLEALAANGIPYDSSYNATHFGLDSGVLPGTVVVEPAECTGVTEVPVTVFSDGLGRLRHTQVTACSYRELEMLLWQAAEAERSSFVLVSHNFEMLNRAMNGPDDTVVRRFRRLCEFLDRNRDAFRTRGFHGDPIAPVDAQPPPLEASLPATALRVLEQAARVRHG